MIKTKQKPWESLKISYIMVKPGFKQQKSLVDTNLCLFLDYINKKNTSHAAGI